VWDFVEEVPFQSYRGFSATLGQTKKTLRLVVKGSPEVLLARCTQALRRVDSGDGYQPVALTRAQRALAEGTVERLARQGLGCSPSPGGTCAGPRTTSRRPWRSSRCWGSSGWPTPRGRRRCPIVQELRRNDIHVVMITGDHPVTAAAVARALGIPADTVVTGAELDALDETASRALVADASVFARVSPEQKVRVVAALQAAGGRRDDRGRQQRRRRDPAR